MKFNIEKVTTFLLYLCFYFSLIVLFLLCKYNKITLQNLGILLFIANEPENCHIFSVANEWL